MSLLGHALGAQSARGPRTQPLWVSGEQTEPREPEAVPHSCASGAVVTTKADLTPYSPFLTQAQGPGMGSLELWLSWWRADP